MAKLQCGILGFALLSAIATAAPNGAPNAQPASTAPAATTLPAPTTAPSAVDTIEELLQFQDYLRKRQDQAATASLISSASSGSSSLVVANSFTSNASNATLPGLASTVSAPGGAIATGMFTAADGGVYDVTSQSGYVVVAGRTMSAGGPGALIGNEPVTEGSNGFMANGVSVSLTPMSTTAAPAPATTSATASMSSSTSATNTVISGSSIIVSTSTRSESAASTITATVSSSSSAAAAAPMQTAAQVVVAAGGLVGMMML